MESVKAFHVSNYVYSQLPNIGAYKYQTLPFIVCYISCSNVCLKMMEPAPLPRIGRAVICNVLSKMWEN